MKGPAIRSLSLEAAVDAAPALRQGVNTYRGYVTHPGAGESQGLEAM